jgi:hypothetical protein
MTATDREVIFHATANMEDGTTETIMKFAVKFPAGESQVEFDTRIKKCAGIVAKAGELGADLTISGDRGIISQFTTLAPPRAPPCAPPCAPQPTNTMTFRVSGLNGTELATHSGRLDLGGGKSASFKATPSK